MTGPWETVLATVAVWWLGTGLLIAVCTRPSVGQRAGLAAGAAVAAIGLSGVAWSAGQITAAGAYVGFLSAIAVWAFVEMAFLTGAVTGPRRTACPAAATGWNRFWLAAQTLLYHEGALVAAALAVAGVSWGGANQTGTMTFLILLAMRLSAKMNLFFGVPNVSDEFLPARLAYLKTYFRKGSMSPLLPVSIAAATAAAGMLGASAFRPGLPEHEAVSLMLLFTLLALAILEHVFMIMPMGDAALWRWALPGSPKPSGKAPPAGGGIG